LLLLSIDTSGKSGGITLAEGDQAGFRILESAPIAGGTFSAQLIPVAASVLQKHGFAPRDLGGFVAVSGPGSFTGLRVGLSAIKGLAEVLKKPIATVSLLEALSVSYEPRERVAAVLDAGRGEAYFGIYEVLDGRGRRIAESVLTHSEFIDAMKKESAALLVSSDPSIVQLATLSGIEAHAVKRPGSEEVAPLGHQKLLSGETIGVEELDANYIRRSDAEIFRR
jgi:tRNA threonylcarbamoyladenosine biosynthesis protein TsaB